MSGFGAHAAIKARDQVVTGTGFSSSKARSDGDGKWNSFNTQASMPSSDTSRARDNPVANYNEKMMMSIWGQFQLFRPRFAKLCNNIKSDNTFGGV